MLTFIIRNQMKQGMGEKAYSEAWKSFLTGDASEPPFKVETPALKYEWDIWAHDVLVESKCCGEPITQALVERVFPLSAQAFLRFPARCYPVLIENILETALYECEIGQRYASLAA